jgi:predicted DNA-binding transcriptional regulator AlpA
MQDNLSLSTSGALRANDAAKFLGIAKSTFWRWVSLGKLPAGRRLSSRCTVWLKEDIERFLTTGGEA